MFYSTDCNYIVKINEKNSYIEFYTNEQLKIIFAMKTGA